MPWDKWFEELVPRVLPANYAVWESHDYENAIGYLGKDKSGPYTVIMTGSIEEDGKKWLHVSVARPNILPSWNLLKEVKAIFIGRNRQAIQVLPSEENYINKHPYCLHLFCCVDTPDPIPNFVKVTGLI